ncbi:NAD(P)-binding protein [Panus rudis PR-1116 ss-1]|nr:NAD(P)-binding protein [Panus rudis PR-1116 ss-1]
MSKNVVIVGGHGKVALRLAHLLKSTAKVTSIIRTEEHAADIKAALANPLVISLEDDPTEAFTSAFEGADVVVFSAGSGGKGGPERIRAVDYLGALKVFDAIEAVKSVSKPRLLMVSAVDVRDLAKIPEHYNEADIALSRQFYETIGASYFAAKYNADKNLVERTAFPWTIIRPSLYNDSPGVGKAAIGKMHITESISRDDVAKTLALLLDRPDAVGLALDVVGGDTPIEEVLDTAIRSRVTAWIG